ncbi:T9SS type A sorting domain-containing protein [Pseudotamlana carrageenivorans]|uniref:Pectate lyase n=1 Tax=Pseudotamlana carrageenivorans TaxID=2069432 RepID=A0A2I7SEL1_9FLAO|nr:T9SS type A sorting domain-containing protein [Tamlana carrageenivorans]AUS04335.1 pectate lyase [Tamlana carrageenivorans]
MFKKLFFFTMLMLSTLSIIAQNVNITEANGWLESAYVKWDPINGADHYNVYYSGEGYNNKKIDDQLIRCYSGYQRADLLGLKAGTYTISVAAVISGVEGPLSTTGNITVLPHDRTGFAFSNGGNPSAYNLDGTVKPNAVILYITENTKNTIELNVTGANANPCVGLQNILEGFKKGQDNRPLIVRLIGQITDLDYMDKGDIVIENKNNTSQSTTLEGVGDDATADGWGIRIKNANNVEIRNIATMNCDSDEGDNIGLQQDNAYVWVHHNDFFYGGAGGDSDQAKGDGALDSKRSGYVTISYNHFWDSGKSNLLGNGTESPEYLTYHHNWYDHSDSRHPRIRSHSVHVYNNYYDGNSKYGVGATNASSVFVEANYFRNCKYPILTSMQGSDVFDESKNANDYSNMPTFSKEDGGAIKAYNNYIEGARRFVAYGDSSFPNSTVDFDAYVVNSRNEPVPSSVTSYEGSNTHNNFDTNGSIMYSYTADSPEDAKNNTMAYAGRMFGGDFTWTFNNATDDTSYAVDSALKAKLTSYATSLVCIQGDQGPDPEVTLHATPGNMSVTLQWTVSHYAANSFTIYRNTSSDLSTRTKLTDITDANTLTYEDLSVTNDTPYFYWVIADASVESNVATATPSAAPAPSPSGDEEHNYTTSGKNSSFYTISGNLSTSKGTVVYNALTLTQCLKIESSTSISFSTVSASTLTLVFNETQGGSIKIDGVSYDIVNGIASISLSAGSHEITKGDTANLYYMNLEYDTLSIDSEQSNTLKLYPNPVKDFLYITGSSQVEKVEVYSIQGVLVLKLESQNIQQINLNELKTGVYLIKTYSSSKVTDKILLKK